MREFDLDLYVVHLLFTSSTPSPSRLSQLQEPQKNVSHITLLFLYANNIYDILIDIAGARRLRRAPTCCSLPGTDNRSHRVPLAPLPFHTDVRQVNEDTPTRGGVAGAHHVRSTMTS